MTDDELRALLAAATPGPWEPHRNSAYWEFCTQAGDQIGDVCASNFLQIKGDNEALARANAALVALAPALAAEVLALRTEVLALRAERDAAKRSSAVEIARRAARSIGDSDGL
jgi:hypothetical protein